MTCSATLHLYKELVMPQAGETGMVQGESAPMCASEGWNDIISAARELCERLEASRDPAADFKRTYSRIQLNNKDTCIHFPH